MIETYTHCATCKTDTRLGVEIHCVLCHTNYPKGTQHTCKAIDDVGAAGNEPEPSTIPERFKNARLTFERADDAPKAAAIPAHLPRTPWRGQQYRDAEVPKE